MPTSVPADLQAALNDLAQGKSRRELMQRAEVISQRYRSGAPSREAIRSADDALAYAYTRLPATYAATSCALATLHLTRLDFGPRSLIDAGAGPGTAAFAAAGQFAALGTIRLIDRQPCICARSGARLWHGARPLRCARRHMTRAIWPIRPREPAPTS